MKLVSSRDGLSLSDSGCEPIIVSSSLLLRSLKKNNAMFWFFYLFISFLHIQVTTSSGRLCQSLKTVVVATKGAAQNYPSVAATQEMVDRVAELSQQAAGFSGLLQRLAEIS